MQSGRYKNLGGLQFAQDGDGNWGYKVGGADTVYPFNKYKYSAGMLKIDQANVIYTISLGWKPKVIALVVSTSNSDPFSNVTRLQLYVEDISNDKYLGAEDGKGVKAINLRPSTTDGLIYVCDTGFEYRYGVAIRYLYYWAVG